MSWLSKLLKKKTGLPEVKIPFGEMFVVNQIIENIDFLSTSDLEKVRDVVMLAIDARKVKK
jgi:hypothetical protein